MNALLQFTASASELMARASDEGDFDPNTVTPGVVGFIITFFVAAATVLIVIDMTRRVRRTRYREEIREKLAAEAEKAEKAEGERPEGQ